MTAKDKCRRGDKSETRLVVTDKKGRQFEVLGTSEYPSVLDVVPKKYGDVKHLAVSVEDVASFRFIKRR